MQRILLGVIAAVAVAGWIAVFFALKSSGDVKERLTATRAELSAVSEKLTNTQNRLRLQQDAAGSLEEIGEQIGSVQAEAATLTRQIKTKTSELQALQQKTAISSDEILPSPSASFSSALDKMVSIGIVSINPTPKTGGGNRLDLSTPAGNDF